jgi:Na+-translocating ferredoxin:NAD+ oxidoreductase subunit B
MLGNRKHNQNNRQGQHQSCKSFAVCTCPECGYSIPHTGGTPCRSLMCPTCMVLLVRGEISKKSILNISEKQIISIQVISTPDLPSTKVFPIVDFDLCIGCKTCVENCPTNAILMVDGKAVIQNELCKKCKKCVRVCPVGAIR